MPIYINIFEDLKLYADNGLPCLEFMSPSRRNHCVHIIDMANSAMLCSSML